ncbi:MAG TPA: helicase-exonuclease AddAB subunit AddA [Clostridia bacterium]|nr:helicase-exonuclease AddAB subunit AddA [Clostridia bacterium]
MAQTAKTKWTKEQTEAIEREGNLLVAAAAGSGKTAVLTERIARLIYEGADVNEFLVVTFTRAAAGEMKKRIAKRLAEAAAEADGELAARLYHAAVGVGQANISTIHSFCTQVLRRHFHMAGIDPNFRVADDADIALMREDALDELTEEFLETEEDAFKRLCEMFGSQGEMREAVLKIHTFMYAKPDPFAWLSNAAGLYRTPEEDILSLPHAKLLLKSSRRALAREIERYSRARDLAADEDPKAAATMDSELLSLRAVLLCEDILSYHTALSCVEFAALRWTKGTPDEIKNPAKAARDACKKVYNKQLMECAVDVKKEAERMAYTAERLDTLIEFLRAFSKRLDEKKAEARAVDYGDLEHLTLKLLENESIAAEYREKFRYIFVDEYQDSNAVQESILKKLCRKDNLFFVGDVKQSIYRFRLAEPKLFLEKYAEYGAERGGTLVDLNANFRSAKNVVDTVNAVFSRVMSKEGAEIEYGSRAALLHGRGDDLYGSAELCLVEKSRPDTALFMEDEIDADDFDEEDATLEQDDADELSDMEDAEAEARVAAGRIHALMASMRMKDVKTGELRALKYGDIAVLHPKPKRTAAAWVETLSACGVPAYAQLKGGYFDAVEVQVFLDLLRVLDNRRQDIPLAAVLRSPIGGFSTLELIELRAEHKTGLLFDALSDVLAYDTPLARKSRTFLEKIARWHEDAALCGLEELLGRLLEDTGYYDFSAALPGGQTRKKNLDALFSMARAYENNGARGLSGFLRFMDRIKNTDSVGEAQTAGADVVRVMSIHAAKGLEFPVVILAGMSGRFNERDANSHLILDAELGIGIRPVMRGVRAQTLLFKAVRENRKFLDTAEQMRLLYVGMTRARDALLMLAAVQNTQKEIEKALVPLTPLHVADKKRFLDWTLAALMDTPCANTIRKNLGLNTIEGGAFCSIALAWPDGGINSLNAVDEGAFRAFLKRAQNTDTSMLEKPFSWEYAYKDAVTLPSKVSVTALSQTLSALREAPDFYKPQKPTPAERGTATHLLMEHLSLKEHTPETVEEELDALIRRGVLTREEAAVVSTTQVADFFSSPLGKRLLRAETAERELEFNCRIPASELMDVNSGEPVLLQGVIDCCFLEDDAWVLIDYKTDYIAPNTPLSEAAQKHARQIALYARALNILTKKPVKEYYVHFLRTGESVRIT